MTQELLPYFAVVGDFVRERHVDALPWDKGAPPLLVGVAVHTAPTDRHGRKLLTGIGARHHRWASALGSSGILLGGSALETAL